MVIKKETSHYGGSKFININHTHQLSTAYLFGVPSLRLTWEQSKNHPYTCKILIKRFLKINTNSWLHKIFKNTLFSIFFISVVLSRFFIIFCFFPRFSFHRSWKLTLFLLNLSLADLVLTACDTPFAVVYFTNKEKLLLGYDGCYALAAFRHVSTFAVWASLGVIAVSR